MNEGPRTPGGPDVDEQGRIDEACDRFEAAWKAGDRPRIEEHLGAAADRSRPALLRELLAVELAYRRRAGERPSPGDYRGRFAGSGGLDGSLLGLFEPASSAPPVERLLGETFPADRPDALPTGEAPAPSEGADRFEILRQHARGGLGTVYRAHDRELDREVALKQIQDRFADRSESRRRFEWEARVTGRLQHPGIVPVYTLGRDAGGRPYYAMRFIEGQSLKEAIAESNANAGAPGRSGPPPRLRELLGRFLSACDAIAYAHSKGVVHRDLKPANIMLGPYGETLVVDWGLAKLVRSTGDPSAPDPSATDPGADGPPLGETATGEILGTPAYMSPEQATGRNEGREQAGDIYGLGATLFAILTGRQPVEAASPQEAIDRVRRGDIDAPRAVAPGVPRALDAVCRKAMARRPGDRYADVTAMADDVRRWLAGEPVSVWPEPLTVRAGRWLARHRTAVFALAASATVLAVLGAVVAADSARRDAAQRLRLEQSYASVRARYGRALSLPHEMTEWRAALAAAQQAAAVALQLPDSGPARRLLALRAEVEAAAREAGRDRSFLDELADVRMAREASGLSDIDEGYRAVFRRFGADPDARPAAVVATLGSRPAAVVRQLSGFLDDWGVVRYRLRSRDDDWRRPIEVARLIDPDPLRNQVRDALGLPTEPARREALIALFGKVKSPGVALEVPSALLLAEALEGLGRSHEAGDLLNLTVQRNPSDLWANYDLAFHLEHYHPGLWQEALRYYSAARALRPDSAHAMAHLLERRGRTGEAIAVFKELVSLRPDLPRHLGCLGEVLTSAGHGVEGRKALASAIEGYRAVLRESPDDPSLHNNLGLALHEVGRAGEAVDSFGKALASNPSDPTYLYNLGRSLRELGRFEEAAGAYRASLANDPRNSRTLNNLGLALRDLGRPREAEEAYRAAVEFDPGLTVAHFNLSNVLREQRKPAEALAAARAALAVEPRNAKALNTLGLALAALGRPSEAVDAYRAAIAADPELTVAHSNLSNALRSLGRFEEAVEAGRAAIAVDPRSAQAHNNLGLALRATGRVEEAVGAYRAALAIDPEQPEALCNLGLALRDRGRFAEALDALERGHRSGSARPGGWRHPSARWIKECRRLIELEAGLPAVVTGDIDPSADRVELADLCHKKSYYSVATRLYAEAFGADPRRADRPTGSPRYNAACSASLASDARGASDPPPTAEERRAFRSSAIDWLGEELAAWSRRLDEDRAAVARLTRTLRRWRIDPDLSPIRDDDSLASLSPEERSACLAVWSRVDELLRSAESAGKKPR